MSTPTHAWTWKPRFRRNAFGWRSQPAIARVKQAVVEIKKAAKTDPLHASDGAVAFLERVSPALEQVDSSSGAIGSAVNHAIAELAELIAAAPADPATREDWLERLWLAFLADEIPYLEALGDHWGSLCASRELASAWADRLVDGVRESWRPARRAGEYFKGTSCCLSALFAAGRHDEILALLERAPSKTWHERQYGVRALVALGKKADALRYAEEGRGLNDPPSAIARACEEILLSSGLVDEAYARYGLAANQAGTYLATFRAVARKYPHRAQRQILDDLVATTPGDEGKWFAAAKDAGLYEEAIALARRSVTDPKTLTRAARDFATKAPSFAIEAGLLALHWLVEGYGYEVTSLDVWAAYDATISAAGERAPEITARVRALVATEKAHDRFVGKILGVKLGL